MESSCLLASLRSTIDDGFSDLGRLYAPSMLFRRVHPFSGADEVLVRGRRSGEKYDDIIRRIGTQIETLLFSSKGSTDSEQFRKAFRTAPVFSAFQLEQLNSLEEAVFFIFRRKQFISLE